VLLNGKIMQSGVELEKRHAERKTCFSVLEPAASVVLGRF
jgi:hypothetical protein